MLCTIAVNLCAAVGKGVSGSIKAVDCIYAALEYAYHDDVQRNSQSICDFSINKKHILFT